MRRKKDAQFLFLGPEPFCGFLAVGSQPNIFTLDQPSKTKPIKKNMNFLDAMIKSDAGFQLKIAYFGHSRKVATGGTRTTRLLMALKKSAFSPRKLQ